MNSLLLAVVCLALFAASYLVYARFLSQKIFALNPNTITPAHALEDGVDYVPTRRSVLFGHHFASIAGLGPIVGPAIGVIWGWLPAVLWVVFGTIFIGAVHDLAALVISMRNEGRSIGDVTNKIIGPRGRMLFMIIIFCLLALAMGVFALVIAKLFVDLHPEAVLPVFSLMIIAVLIGFMAYRLKINVVISTVVGVALMLAMIYIGMLHPVPVFKVFLPAQRLTQLAEICPGGRLGASVLVEDPGDSDLQPMTVYPRAQAVETAEAIYKQGGNQPVFHGLSVWKAASAALAAHIERTDPAGGATEAEAVGKDFAAAAGSAKRLFIFVLLGYAFVASVLPVWLLLQPRDYLNSYKLYLGMALMIIGLFVFHPPIAAPAINANLTAAGGGSAVAGLFKFVFSGTKTLSGESELPGMFPLMFMLIACGAVSGFHSLVSSGTTAKQISNETEARIVGYGGMLFEGVLAIIVIIACTAGVAYVASAGDNTPAERWAQRYSSFSDMKDDLDSKLDAVITGGGLLMSKAGLPFNFSTAFVAAVAVAFAMTTLDTGTRLLRYNIEEFGSILKFRLLTNRYFASAMAVAALAFFAFRPKQAITLWTLFGASNQLLAVLGLLVATVYIYRRGKSVVYTLVPMLFLATATVAAMVSKIREFWPRDGKGDLGLVAVASIVLLIAAWLCIEGILAVRGRDRESIDAEPADSTAS